PPFDRPGPPPGATVVRTARVWVVALTVVLVELIVILAGGNTWTTPKIIDAERRANSRLLANFEGSLTTFSWRWSPSPLDHHNVLLGQVLMIATVLVGSVLLFIAVVHGPITFWRAFFGTWTAVIVATLLGAGVR